MTQPYFSVILPVYNAQKTLKTTIESVLNQTEDDFEFIIIDDGSTDDCLSLMLALSAQDSRIRFISQANKGVSATRNLAMKLAHGKFIAFIDSDDHWHADKLAQHRLVHSARPDVDASFAKVVFVEQNDEPEWDKGRKSSVTNACYSAMTFLAENPSCTMSNVVVSRKTALAVGDFLDHMSFAEDQEWLLRLLNRNHKLLGIDRALVGYMASDTGLSANFEAMLSGWQDLYSRYGQSADKSAAEALYFRYLARRALRMGA